MDHKYRSRPLRFGGTPAAKSRHTFALVTVIASTVVGFLTYWAPGMDRLHKFMDRETEFDKVMRNREALISDYPFFSKHGANIRIQKENETEEEDTFMVR